jgi:receptor protein-tyrosine kinase
MVHFDLGGKRYAPDPKGVETERNRAKPSETEHIVDESPGAINSMTTEPPANVHADTGEDEYALSLADILAVLRRRAWVIVLVAILCASAAIAFSMTRTPLYEGTITILVGQDEGIVSESPGNVQGLQSLTETMAEAVDSRPVAQAAIDRLGLSTQPDELLSNLRVEQVPNTQFVQAAYTDSSPEEAQRVANTIGDVFSEQISEVSPSASAITATIWERAAAPQDPVSPDPVRDGLLALVLGLMLGVGLAFLMEYFDNTWRAPEEAERVSGVPTFGFVPKFDPPKGTKKPARNSKNRGEEPLGDLAGHLATVIDPSGIASESYRTLRTNLLYTIVGLPLQVVTLTSAGLGEGKSTTCANLAVTLAQAGKKVLVLDCDLRRPALHKAYSIRNLHGLVNVVAGERELPDAWSEPIEGLKVVTAGPVPPNPAELLGSSQLELIQDARSGFDYILLDTPPVQAVSDALVLSSYSDGTLLILDAQETRKGSVRRAVHSLEGVGAHILGTVMNNVKADKDGYFYGYSYEYGSR